MAIDESPPLRAIVLRVIDGPKGYVITHLHGVNFVAGMASAESVTFALAAWLGNGKPKADQVVLLVGVHLFKHGWRATNAFPVTLQRQQIEKEKHG